MAAANQNTQNKPDLQDITANQFRIEKGALLAGDTSFQIRNITSLEIYSFDNRDEVFRKRAFAVIAAIVVAYIPVAMMAGILHYIGLPDVLLQLLALAAIVTLVLAMGKAIWRFFDIETRYVLKILTNAASSYRIVAGNRTIIVRVKAAIEDAMSAPNNPGYIINIEKQIVEKIEANTTTVSNSPGANTIGGNATNVSQTSNVSITTQGLQDITALIELVARSNAENTALLKVYLEEVRAGLAKGGAGKADAKTAWGKFVQHVGQLASTGNDVWTLVGRISALFG